jgi:hypothetical protein
MKNTNQTTNSNLSLEWSVTDEKLNKSEKLNFQFSKHSYQRSQERNISSDRITTAIEYGKEFFKQGLIFYVLGENNLPKGLSPKERKKYKNLVVVVAGDDNTIVTCYRSKNPFKHVKMKRKELNTSYKYAA